MEFVETPTFWCPHVDPTACSNFSPQTVEPRPPESGETFLFPFLLSPFSSLFSQRTIPLFVSLFPFISFLFAFLFFSIFSSHFLLIFSFPLVIFSPFLEQPLIRSKGENFLPISSNQRCGYHFFPSFSFISLFSLMTSSLTWLNVSHGIHATHVAQCEPFLFMPSVTLLWCHVASPNLAMCHPTSHASKNVKS